MSYHNKKCQKGDRNYKNISHSISSRTPRVERYSNLIEKFIRRLSSRIELAEEKVSKA